MGKGTTIKFTYRGVDFIKFFATDETFDEMTAFDNMEFDIVGKCSVNEWQGKVTPQIIIEDYNVKKSNEIIF